MHSATLANNFPFRLTLAFAPFQPLLSCCGRCFPGKSRVLILLRTLVLSLRSFRRSPRLFSIICGLFVQNTGGVGTSATSPLPALSFALFLSPLCFHGLTTCFSRKPFILITICVAPPGVGSALLSPSFSTALINFGSAANFLFAQARVIVHTCKGDFKCQ